MNLSLVFQVYNNPMMLAAHYRIMRTEWSDLLKAEVEVVIVDDGSAVPAADVERPDGLPHIQMFRVLVDRPWNQAGARNLGAAMARGSWLLVTDVDHIVPPDTLQDVLALIAARGPDCMKAWMFARRDAPATETWMADHWPTMAITTDLYGRPKPHPNSYLMSRRLWNAVGGADESYCGIYGTDSLYRRRLFKAAKSIGVMSSPLIRVSREVIPDASTTTLPRKDGRDPNARARITREKAKKGETDVVKTLQFPWERII